MTPKILTAHDIFRELCKHRQQWGLYFSISFMPGETPEKRTDPHDRPDTPNL